MDTTEAICKLQSLDKYSGEKEIQLKTNNQFYGEGGKRGIEVNLGGSTIILSAKELYEVASALN